MTAITPRHAAIELLVRYRAILGAAWQARHELAGPKRLADEAAFLPAALSLQDTPLHPAPRRAIWVVIAFFSTAVGWSVFGKVDVVAVAQGRIVVSERTKAIQPLETSVIKAIHVAEGDHVTAGQVVVDLDATGAAADQKSNREQIQSLDRELARSQALLDALHAGHAPRRLYDAAAQALLSSEWADVNAKLARMASEGALRQAELSTLREALEKLRITVPLARQREADVKSLSEQGFVANHVRQDRTRERIEQERDLATQAARVKEAEASLAQSWSTRAAFLAETQRALSERLADAKLKHSQLTQEATKADQRSSLRHLASPVTGTVQQLAVHTAGGVATEAQVLMLIVPDGAEVTAEVVIDNKDIGFVHEGQTVEIKLETFNFTRYGTVQGRVKRVSADAVQDEKRGAVFTSTITPDRNTIDVDGKRIRLTPGMNLTAEIKTGRRRVIDYFLSPIQTVMSESIKER